MEQSQHPHGRQVHDSCFERRHIKTLATVLLLPVVCQEAWGNERHGARSSAKVEVMLLDDRCSLGSGS